MLQYFRFEEIRTAFISIETSETNWKKWEEENDDL